MKPVKSLLLGLPALANTMDQVVQVDKTYEYSAWISYFEIYNEKIFNLLDTSSLDSPEITSLQPRHYSMNGPFAGPSGGLGPSNSDSFLVKRKALTLKNDPDGGKYIANLREIRVRTAEEAKAIVKLGQANRKVFGTLANQVSSRSHSVFTIKIMKSKGAIPVSHINELKDTYPTSAGHKWGASLTTLDCRPGRV